jgi:hypothetical protein
VFTLGGIGEYGANVFTFQAGKVAEDLILAHSAGQILEYVRRGKAGSTEARLYRGARRALSR